jgi:hypothetical protein
MLERVRPEQNGGRAGEIRKTDWITLFRTRIHEMQLPEFRFKPGTQFGTAVAAMMECVPLVLLSAHCKFIHSFVQFNSFIHNAKRARTPLQLHTHVHVAQRKHGGIARGACCTLHTSAIQSANETHMPGRARARHPLIT